MVTRYPSDPGNTRVPSAVDEACREVATATGLDIAYLGDDSLGPWVHRHSWVDSRSTTVVDAIDDAQADASYVEILADDEVIADAIADALSRRLRTETLPEAVAAASTEPLQPRAVNRLGLFGGAIPDPRIADALTWAMANDDPAVRHAAANAAGLLSWSGLVEPLESMVRDEGVPNVREMAARALELCRPPV